jgi:hypothetical protein
MFLSYPQVFPGTSPLEPMMNPTTQASSLTFLMMCVPSMAIFCKESIECCPGIVSRYIFKHLLTIPVAPMIICCCSHYYYYSLQSS